MKRNLKTNIVIVCEGTDTEVNYLRELVEYAKATYPDRFSKIDIVPTPEELKICEARNKNKKKRKLANDYMGGWYYTIGEPDPDDYKKYCQQPTRYVREAQLYLADGSFSEAWAVYDKDIFPDHKNARDLADTEPNLHIAYSSIAIEEWLLLHFECNPKAFVRSVCKDNKKDILCGTGRHPADCHGTLCVGGRLRENFLPDYEKTNEGLFYRLLPRLTQARAGAAWTRQLQPEKDIWERNPYTDFDKLVDRLLGQTSFKWCREGEELQTTATKLKIEGVNLVNCGNGNFVDCVEILDADFNSVGKERLVLASGDKRQLISGEYIILPYKGESLIISAYE